MATFQETLIETLKKDIESVKSLDDMKLLRKECSLLLKRIESTKKIFLGNEEQIQILNSLGEQIKKLKN